MRGRAIEFRSMGSTCRHLAAAGLVAAGLVAFDAPASGDGHLGLIRGRDLSPFGFLRLDMRPAHAATAAPGQWAVEVELGYQNTWALSPNVQDYLDRLPGRRRLGPAEIAAIRALPGEKFLADLELGLLDLAFHRRLDAHWSVYAIAGAVAYGGGFMDGLIEGFHKGLGLGDFGRPALGRDEFNVLFDLKETHFVQQGAPRAGGLLDPTVGVRYAWAPRADPWNLILEAAVKVPVGGKRAYLSNGHADTGVQATVQRVAGRHGAYASASAVYTETSLFGNGGRRQAVPTGILGYEYAPDGRTQLLAQASISRSTLGRRETDLESLRKNKYQVSAGIRHRVGGAVLTFAITENVANFNNTPDIGFQVGWVWAPGPGANPR